jgi:hypothetical protein
MMSHSHFDDTDRLVDTQQFLRHVFKYLGLEIKRARAECASVSKRVCARLSELMSELMRN